MTSYLGAELLAADQWLYDTLTADTALMAIVTGVYDRVAPAGAVFPYLIFQNQTDPQDMMVVGSQRIWSDITYVVKVIGRVDTYSTFLDAMARIDAVLHRNHNSPVINGNGSLIIDCVRTQQFAYVELVDGDQIRHMGGVFTINVQAV